MMRLKHKLPFAFIIFAVGIGSVVVQGAYRSVQKGSADTSLTYTMVGTHPKAATETTASAKQIRRLQAFNGKLFAGYGDYTANVGPIDLMYYDPATGQFVKAVTQSTESIETLREIRSKLYSPDIDPIAGETSGGYASGGPPWTTVRPIPSALHLFDIVGTGTSDLWIAGSSGDRATVWHSPDNGASWSVSLSVPPPSGSGYERFYWIGEVGGKIFVQCAGCATSKYYQNGTWYDGPYVMGFAAPPLTFNGKLVFASSSVTSFDGSRRVTNLLPPAGGAGSYVNDIYVSGRYLYALRSDRTLLRTTDLSTWESLGQVPTGSVSMAVLNDRVYTGTTSSQIYESSVIGSPPPPSDTTSPTVSLTAPANNATVSGVVTLSATASDNVGVTLVEFLINDVVVGSDSSSPYSYAWNSSTKPDGAHTVKAKARDAAGNTQTTGGTAVTIDNIPDSPGGGGGGGSGGGDSPAEPPTNGPVPFITSTGDGSVKQTGNQPVVTGQVVVQAPTNLKDSQGNAFVVVKAEYYIDGKLLVVRTEPPFKVNIDTTKLSEGSHQLVIKVYNDKGEVKETSQQLLVDNQKFSPWTLVVSLVLLASLVGGLTYSWRQGLVQRLIEKFHRNPPPPPSGGGYVVSDFTK